MQVCPCQSEPRLARTAGYKESEQAPALEQELNQVADPPASAEPRAGNGPRASAELRAGAEPQTRAKSGRASTFSPSRSKAEGGAGLASCLSLPEAAALLESTLFEGRELGYRFWARWACR